MVGRERYKINTWYDVPSKKGRRPGQDDGSKNNGVAVTKFFVSNLSGSCASLDLYVVLKGFGDINGTHIARKYNKLGKRFGLVSFRNVKDPLSLEKDLKDGWIGSYKLFIVLARFVDGEKVSWKEEKQWVPVNEKKVEKNVNEKPNMVDVDQPGPTTVNQHSFKDTLLDKDPGQGLLEVAMESNFQGSLQWKGLGLVGRAHCLRDLTSLRVWLSSIGMLKVGIRYVGGLWAVLVFEDQKTMVEFHRSKEMWMLVFGTLDHWEGQRLPVERIAWLKIFGVPLCLFEDCVFNDTGSKFGTVIQPAQVSEVEEDLSHVMIGVLCDSVYRINTNISLKWRKEVFSVVIEEEVGDWTPDCLEWSKSRKIVCMMM
ncbi:putative nucleotide-binding alpha-beta plait domain superfamily, RNA-binding domain superfamily [Helianthus annuus]|nr:putative nucleotide-binding alpha-beta plait domain superfamily, RNA-binding domain superfamily [Helianthus annuus]KAJ0629387.1 putative nucleotide-binding alpha-beta plait domain superfamily, RNA-binding domain superfamily [Helianthus annuus]